MRRQAAQEAILFPLHSSPGRGVLVVEAAQVEQAVNEVAEQLGLPGGAVAPGMDDGLVNANEDFPVQKGGGAA